MQRLQLFHNQILASPAFYIPGSGEHGPRFLTGGLGAAPGGVALKNGWVYMRVQEGGFISYGRFVCLSVRLLWHTKWQFRSAALSYI